MMSSWQLIKEAHSAASTDSSTPYDWSESVLKLLDILHELIRTQPKEKTSCVDPPPRDQLLVLLTVFIKLTDPNENTLGFPLLQVSTVLVELITSQDDPYITNLATKCLCQCLVSKPHEVGEYDVEWYIPVLKQCLRCLRAGEKLGSIIELFRLLLSKHTMVLTPNDVKDTEMVRVWCVHELIRLWRPLVQDVFTASLPKSASYESGVVNMDLISLLSLWLKLIKRQHIHLGSDLLTLDDRSFVPLQTTTTQLVNIITQQHLQPVLFDKFCDVLNRTLLYGSSTDQFQYGTGEGRGFLVELSAEVLKGVQAGMLDNVPQKVGERDFVGSKSTTEEKESVETECQQTAINFQSVRKVALLVLKACAMVSRSTTYAGISLANLELVLGRLWSWGIQMVLPSDHNHWLFVVFGDQDDYLVEALLCMLDIYTTVRWKYTAEPVDSSKVDDKCCRTDNALLRQHGSDPHEIFLHFIGHTTMDHTVMLDMLTSPETCFLLYLVRYLRHAASTWEQLADICLTWTPLPEKLDDKCTPRPLNNNQTMGACISKLTDNVPFESQQSQDIADSSVAVVESGMPIHSDICAKSEITTASCVTPNVIVTPPDESTVEPIVKMLSNAEPADQTLHQSLVAYSDDSLSESDGESCENANAECSESSLLPTSCLGAEADSALDSAASDLGRSLTTSLTSLTSVTSDLEMPSDLQYIGIDTDVEDGVLDQVMTILIRLRLVIERLDDKGLFPYNASALRHLLRQTEVMYDGLED